ncbi:MAG: TlpA family protein disulfide reductase [Bacteroidetes bacterium]|nr:TlpA family protein disulfide reductase [Bacteroidota bacterium]
MKIFISFFLLMVCFCMPGLSQNKLAILPEHPKAGDQITIIYNPEATGAAITDTATDVELIFTYSNFYELPSKIEMEKTGNKWKTSFILPRYGVYATFILQSGNVKDLPSPKQHYAICIYDSKGRRVKNSYLYESYSLTAQEGKSVGLAKKQANLLNEELRNYPDNYEAKLRLIVYQISQSDETEKLRSRKIAREIIAAKFNEKPGDMGHMNSTTMGYLIIGENSRLDSLREVVKKKYPKTEAGYELRIEDINSKFKGEDLEKALLTILKEENNKTKKYLKDAHALLFDYYASKGQTKAALTQLNKLGEDHSPYTPLTLKNQATTLYKNGIALDKAIYLAKRSLAMADTFPITLTRYFPETGYLPSFVSRTARSESIKKVTGNLQSLIALIKLKQGKQAEADVLLKKALVNSKDAETLANAGEFYQLDKSFEKAFIAYKTIAFDNPEDTLAFIKMKNNYVKWKKDDKGLDAEIKMIHAHWQEELKAILEKEMISKSAPEFLSNIIDLKGNPVSSELIRNKIVVVDFWATWCVPCMHEMPYLQLAYEKYSKDTNVIFMVINSGAKNELSDAQNWWGNKKFTFPVYFNTNKNIGEIFGFNLIPATYIIDAKNNIRFKTIGFEGPVIERKIPAAIELLREYQVKL